MLPSYLCESILVPFRKLKRPYEFYRIDKNLAVDLDDLRKLMQKLPNSPLMVIDYFGFNHSQEFRDLLAQEKRRGRIVIQDRSQSSLSSFANYGSIVFNSFRKIGPADGSRLEYEKHLLTKVPALPQQQLLDKSAIYKVTGQLMRHYHIKRGGFPAERFIALFAKAEHSYYCDHGGIKSMLGIHNRLFRALDPESIKNKRRENYGILANMYASLSLMPDKLPEDVTPLFFAIKHAGRDSIRKQLMKCGIFTGIHWIMPKELIGGNKYRDSYELSCAELSIPVDHRNGAEDMAVLSTKLAEYL